MYVFSQLIDHQHTFIPLLVNCEALTTIRVRKLTGTDTLLYLLWGKNHSTLIHYDLSFTLLGHSKRKFSIAPPDGFSLQSVIGLLSTSGSNIQTLELDLRYCTFSSLATWQLPSKLSTLILHLTLQQYLTIFIFIHEVWEPLTKAVQDSNDCLPLRQTMNQVSSLRIIVDYTDQSDKQYQKILPTPQLHLSNLTSLQFELPHTLAKSSYPQFIAPKLMCTDVVTLREPYPIENVST